MPASYLVGIRIPDMRKSYIHILSLLKENKNQKHILAKGNSKARQKAKKFLKKTHNKLKRLEDKKLINDTYS